MPHAPGVGSYRAVFRLPFALRTFVPALAGRLAYGVFPLATLFTVQQATGSYATAGAAVAAFGLASITLPAKARLADRFGQRATLPPMAVLCAAALTAAAFVTDGVTLVALIGAAGLAAPPLGPAMRSTWRQLTAGTDLKERAYAVDAIAEESLYLLGPLLAGLLVAVRPAAESLLLTAFLLVAGTAGMVAAPPAGHREPAAPPPRHNESATRRQRRAAPPHRRNKSATRRERRAAGARLFGAGPLRSPALRGLLAVMLVVAAGVSAAFPGLVAAAQAAGEPGAAGLLEAALAVGSVLGGLLWARRFHTRRRSVHLALLTAVLAAGLTGAATTSALLPPGAALSLTGTALTGTALTGTALALTGLALVGMALILTGTALAPLYVVAYLAADDYAEPARRTEASTWINVAANAGTATGTALAGVLVDAGGPPAAFLAGGALLAVTAAVIRTFGRPLDRSGPAPIPASI
jgi:MFS family permease